MPEAFTIGVAVLDPDKMFPPFVATQLKVTPEVVDEPLSGIEVTEQVNTLSEPAFALGGVLFTVTKAISVAVHPPAETVKV